MPGRLLPRSTRYRRSRRAPRWHRARFGWPTRGRGRPRCRLLCRRPTCGPRLTRWVPLEHLAARSRRRGGPAPHRGASIGAVLADTTNGDLYVNSGTALVPVWTQVTLQTTASTTELNYLDDTVPGTAVASKVLALGAPKNID